MFIARVCVLLAILCTLAFNGAYAYSRGATGVEQTSLVLLALIIDLAKTSFLAAAARLCDHRQYAAALIIFVLWFPAFALSTWNGYSYIATSRATTAAVKSTATDSRQRTQTRYDQARRKLDLITADKAFTATAGCSQVKGTGLRAFCAGYDAAMIELKAAQSRLAKEIDSTATPGQIIERENRRWAETGPDMLAEYRRVTYSLRDRLVSEGILDLPPGESCDVISTPSFLRPMLPTAAYSSPGPLDKHQVGIFYVSDPPKSLPAAEYLANVAQHFPVDPTCAHEAYPGHHVQLCWANQAPSLIRKLADHIIFMEGWTLYCEQMMVELGWYPSQVYELGYLNDQLWRACRIVIDTSLHSGEMTIDQAIQMLQKEVGFTPMRAKAELNWYTQSPGTPMSYLLGKGKTLALREAWMAKNPGGTIKQFHGWLLTQGSVPQGWLMETLG